MGAKGVRGYLRLRNQGEGIITFFMSSRGQFLMSPNSCDSRSVDLAGKGLTGYGRPIRNSGNKLLVLSNVVLYSTRSTCTRRSA